jgi:hypothetical protein
MTDDKTLARFYIPPQEIREKLEEIGSAFRTKYPNVSVRDIASLMADTIKTYGDFLALEPELKGSDIKH